MSETSLPPEYFERIFAGDPDPWDLGSSTYEAGKFDRTIAALADRRASSAFEVGCAGGTLTARLSALCDRLLAIDVSDTAVERARQRLASTPCVQIERAVFPQDRPDIEGLDLVVLSEVAYYWSDADLDAAAGWIAQHLQIGGRVILVHWTGATDYPQTADQAVARLWRSLAEIMRVELQERHDRYRLDLWVRR